MNFVLELGLIASGLSLVSLLIQKKLIDQEKASELKDKIKELRNKMANVKEEKREMEKIQKKLMDLQIKYLRMSMRASFPTMFIFLLAYWLMGKRYKGFSVSIPLKLPILGGQLSWIFIFIVFSIISNLVLRKLLKVE